MKREIFLRNQGTRSLVWKKKKTKKEGKRPTNQEIGGLSDKKKKEIN